MSDHKQPSSPENDPALDHVPAQKEPWQRPTLESLDMSDSETNPGMGGDGGVASSLS
jgi:hypothetical protein